MPKLFIHQYFAIKFRFILSNFRTFPKNQKNLKNIKKTAVKVKFKKRLNTDKQGFNVNLT